MKQAERRKFHYIYKITRNDGKYYIGMHSTDDLEDGYFGSGQLLWKSIKKHGKEKHSKEILEFLPSRKELKERERVLVNEEILNDPLCMNLKLGGEGGWDHIPASIRKNNALNNSGFIHRNKMSPEALHRCLNPSQFRSDDYERWIDKDAMNAMLKRAREIAIQPENLAKRCETFKQIKHQSGSSNSQFGTKWLSKDGVAKKVKVNDVPGHLEDGWKLGRK